MIETGSRTSIHIFSYHAPAPCRRDDWNASILLYKECSINDSDYEGWDDWSWLIFPWARLYLDPTPAGWDYWNVVRNCTSPFSNKTQPPRVGMIETSDGIALLCNINQTQPPAGWDDWNHAKLYKFSLLCRPNPRGLGWLKHLVWS